MLSRSVYEEGLNETTVCEIDRRHCFKSSNIPNTEGG